MDISKEEILQTAEDLIPDSKLLPAEELEAKYGPFKARFPKLYEMCVLGDEGALKTIAMMLGVRQERIDGTKSELASNVQIGEYFGKIYVYPKTGTPTLEQKKVALKKIVKAEAKKKEDAAKGLTGMGMEQVPLRRG